MHLDHEKFVELLVETSGIDKDKVQKQLQELVDEINTAMGEGDAYEIEGFGVFMSLGNKINFVPSKGLETEINYKYAGMQPIDLSEQQSEQGDADEEEEDPFAFLDSEQEEQEEEHPGPEKWGIDTYKDEEGASNVFGALMGEAAEEEHEESQEEEPAHDEDQKEKEPLQKDASDSKEKEQEDEIEDEEFDPFAIAGSEFKDPGEEEKTSGKEEAKQEQKKPDSTSKSKEKPSAKKPKDTIPVIKGVGKGTSAEPKKKEPEPKSEDKSPAAYPRSQRKQSNPILLVLVIILALGAVIFGAYQFGFFSSFEESEPVTQAANPSPPAAETNIQNEPDNPVQDNRLEDDPDKAANNTDTNTGIPEDIEPEQEQTQPNQTTNASAAAENVNVNWGLNGTPVENLTGYTIVLYSLTNEENARSARNRLQNEGYRALVTPFNSSQYGNMWRVSIGQFKTIPDAAFAMDSVAKKYKRNYFITKIN